MTLFLHATELGFPRILEQQKFIILYCNVTPLSIVCALMFVIKTINVYKNVVVLFLFCHNV